MKISSTLNARRALLVFLAAGAIGLWCRPAAANGRFPAANQIVFSTTDPQLIVLRTTYGILVTRDGGGTWTFLCEDSLGIGPSSFADPSIGLTQDNSLLVGVALGLDVSHDLGCNWNCVGGPLANQTIVDLAVRPDSPNSAVAITGSYEVAADSGQSLTHSQIFETTDDGVTWAALGTPIDPQVTATTVEVAKTDPARLYVAGTRGYGPQRNASLFMSKDRGQTWAEWPLPADQFDPATEVAIYIGAVDPTNADRVFIRSSGLPQGGRSRLTVATLAPDSTPMFVTAQDFTIDAGPVIPYPELLGFALSADGTRVYIGTKEDGLWTAQTSDLVFRQTSTAAIDCLATRGAELWACSYAEYGFVVGVSTDDGTTFASRLAAPTELSGPIDCAPNAAGAACRQTSNASQCGAAYDNLCNIFGCTDAGSDASVQADATSPADASFVSPVQRHKSSSSCSVAPAADGDAGTAVALAAGLASLGLASRRRTGRR